MSGQQQIKDLQIQQQQYQQEEQMFEGQPPPPQQEPPRTMVIECNKSLSEQDGYADKPNAWVNKFPAIKLKKGDIVSVNSAFLSSRGAGDLLQFDDTNSKTRMIFEYYSTNDNVNGKRPAYNMFGDGVANPYTISRNHDKQLIGRENVFPSDYRPMRLYRLMDTFNLSNDGDGSFLPEKINSTTASPYPQIAGTEANWGYKRAGQQIMTGMEDDYVPGLLRHPTVNIREHIFTNGEATATDGAPPTESYWADNLDAAIWYISTPKSLLSPCSPEASMRIHFQFGHDGTKDLISDASLALVKKLRPGMILKWIDPEYLFGMKCRSYMHAVTYEETPGSNCWYCDSYAEDSDGVIIDGDRVDSFRQVGDLRGGAFHNTLLGAGIDLMKITKVFANVDSTNMGGSTTATTLANCPYIEVISDRSYSLAWGNPNLYLPQSRQHILQGNL